MAAVLTPDPALTRGAMVLVTFVGEYGKTRPAVIVQADGFNTTSQESFVVVPFTSEILTAPIFRLTVDPTSDNGLQKVSQLMIDKLTVTPRSRIKAMLGRLEDDHMLRVTRAMALWLGIGPADQPGETT